MFEIEKIENPFDKKPIKKDPGVGLNDTLLDLDDFKPEETIKEKLKKAAEEKLPAAEDNAEKLKGDMGHLLMLEKKIEKLKEAIARGEDFEKELLQAQQEYDKYFKEYSEKIKESIK